MKTNEHAALAEARGDGLYRAVAIANGVKHYVPGYEATTHEIAKRAAREYLQIMFGPEEFHLESEPSD